MAVRQYYASPLERLNERSWPDCRRPNELSKNGDGAQFQDFAGLNVDALYVEDGEYRYQGGFNIVAFIAAGVGALFSSTLPNFTSWLPSWWGVYGWFFGVAIAGVTYFALSMLMPRHAPQAAT